MTNKEFKELKEHTNKSLAYQDLLLVRHRCEKLLRMLDEFIEVVKKMQD